MNKSTVNKIGLLILFTVLYEQKYHKTGDIKNKPGHQIKNICTSLTENIHRIKHVAYFWEKKSKAKTELR